MEAKKTYKADLEHGRKWRLLAGLAISLAAFFAVLEYRWTPSFDDIDESLLDDVARDMELLPALQQQDMIALSQLEEPQAPTPRLNIVEKEVAHEVTERLVQQLQVALNAESIISPDEVNAPLLPVALDESDQVLSFREVEKLPEYPGGMVEFMKWLTRNLKYPADAKRAGVQGKVVVSFVINQDGTTCDHRIVKSHFSSMDREVLRVLKLMPNWKPGEDKGKPCRTMFVIPVVFML